jgi:hypothetical protein
VLDPSPVLDPVGEVVAPVLDPVGQTVGDVVTPVVDPAPAPPSDPSPPADPTPILDPVLPPVSDLPLVDPAPGADVVPPAPTAAPTPPVIQVAPEPTHAPAPIAVPAPALAPAPAPAAAAALPAPVPATAPAPAPAPAATSPAGQSPSAPKPIVAPAPVVDAPPPLIAAPATDDAVLGPPMPSRTRAAAVRAVVGALLASAAATEAVVGVFFSSALLGGSLPMIPGTGGVPIVILGPSIGLMLLAVVNSELGRDLKITSRVINGRTVYFVTGPGLHGIVLVFGSELGSVLVVGDPHLLPPGFLAPGLVPIGSAPTELPAGLLSTLRTLAHPSVSVVRAASTERHAATVEPAIPTGLPAGAPTGGAPVIPSVPLAPSAPVPPAPVTSSGASSGGATDGGGHAPVSAVLTERNPLEALMYAGLLRLQQWVPSERTVQLLASPG